MSSAWAIFNPLESVESQLAILLAAGLDEEDPPTPVISYADMPSKGKGKPPQQPQASPIRRPPRTITYDIDSPDVLNSWNHQLNQRVDEAAGGGGSTTANSSENVNAATNSNVFDVTNATARPNKSENTPPGPRAGMMHPLPAKPFHQPAAQPGVLQSRTNQPMPGPLGSFLPGVFQTDKARGIKPARIVRFLPDVHQAGRDDKPPVTLLSSHQSSFAPKESRAPPGILKPSTASRQYEVSEPATEQSELDAPPSVKKRRSRASLSEPRPNFLARLNAQMQGTQRSFRNSFSSSLSSDRSIEESDANSASRKDVSAAEPREKDFDEQSGHSVDSVINAVLSQANLEVKQNDDDPDLTAATSAGIAERTSVIKPVPGIDRTKMLEVQRETLYVQLKQRIELARRTMEDIDYIDGVLGKKDIDTPLPTFSWDIDPPHVAQQDKPMKGGPLEEQGDALAEALAALTLHPTADAALKMDGRPHLSGISKVDPSKLNGGGNIAETGKAPISVARPVLAKDFEFRKPTKSNVVSQEHVTNPKFESQFKAVPVVKDKTLEDTVQRKVVASEKKPVQDTIEKMDIKTGEKTLLSAMTKREIDKKHQEAGLNKDVKTKDDKLQHILERADVKNEDKTQQTTIQKKDTPSLSDSTTQEPEPPRTPLPNAPRSVNAPVSKLGIWQVEQHKDGKRYYHHTHTKESKWEQPYPWSIIEERASRQPWRIRFTAKGRTCFFNPQTNATVWTMPEEFRKALGAQSEQFRELSG